MSLRVLLATVTAMVLAMLVAAPANAALEWQPGTIEQSTVSNCNFDPETGIYANAEFQADQSNLPKVGDIFYVRTIPGRVGNGCGSGMSVHVEIVPPADVAPAISSSTPVRCNYMDIDTGTLTPASGCPQAAQSGVYGIAFDQVTPGGATETAPWDLPYGQALVIEIPLKASATHAGAGPTCSRYNGDPPCTSSGDSLQFADKVIDGYGSPWLSPWVGLFVEPAASGGSTGGSTTTGGSTGGGSTGGSTGTTGGQTGTVAPTAGSGTLPLAALIAAAPRAVKIPRLLSGLAIKVNVADAGSKVIAQLTVKSLGAARAAKVKVIATRTVTATRAGALAMKLKPSRATARALRHTKHALKATLRVRVLPPHGTARTATSLVTLRP